MRYTKEALKHFSTKGKAIDLIIPKPFNIEEEKEKERAKRFSRMERQLKSLQFLEIQIEKQKTHGNT